MYSKIAITLLLFFGFAFSADYNFPQIEGWQKQDTVAVYDASNLWERINGAADLFLNYGFQELSAVDLRKGSVGLALEIYDMGTPLNAFGIYNTEAPGSKTKLNIGAQAVVSPPAQGFMFKDKYYVKLDVFEGKLTAKDGAELFKAVEKALPGKDTMPSELSMLPEKSRLPGSVSFVKNGFQGLSELQNCLTASYKDADGKEFSYFILVSDNSASTDLLKEISKKWKTVEHKKHKVYYREIPYKGFIGLTDVNGIYLGVTDSENKDLMLKRLDALYSSK